MERRTEFKAIGTKIPVEEYLLIDKFFKAKGEKPASAIRRLLLDEIKITLPQNIAGNNLFEYNKDRDTFSWFVLLDDGQKIEVLRNVSPEYLKDLQKVIAGALNERGNAIREQKTGSVAIPGKLLRVKK